MIHLPLGLTVNILVPNLGSTSLKWQLLKLPEETVAARGRAERVSDYAAAIGAIDTGGAPIEAIALKAVLAGPDYRGTFVVDAGVIAALERYLPASPVHNRIYLDAIRAFQQVMPATPIVAAFETEFHRTMPEHVCRYGVPARWHDAHGVRRYGFHGASHQFIATRVPEMLGRPVPRLVSCHLGGSSSMCAIRDGESVDTTMGFSPQSGLENATRHGELDAFAVLTVMEREGLTNEQTRKELASSGGLAGLSGLPGGDVRDLEAAALEGNENARLALNVFSYQVKKNIGAYTAAMGGLDAIAFTGGIGENSARLRAQICAGLECLGVRLDPKNNEEGSGDRIVSAADSRVTVLILATNEELVVARRAYKLLSR